MFRNTSLLTRLASPINTIQIHALNTIQIQYSKYIENTNINNTNISTNNEQNKCNRNTMKIQYCYQYDWSKIALLGRIIWEYRDQSMVGLQSTRFPIITISTHKNKSKYNIIKKNKKSANGTNYWSDYKGPDSQ